MPPRYRHLKRWLAIGAVAIVALVMLRIAWGRHQHAALEAAVAAIEAKGEPIRFNDMQRPPVPDADNAAFHYRQALANWPRLADGRLVLETEWYHEQASHDDPVADNVAYLATCAAVFEDLRRATNAPATDWHVQLVSPALQILLPHLGQMRGLMRLIDDAAVRAHAAGNDALAVELVHAMMDLADALDAQQHALIDHMVALSVRATAINRLEFILPALRVEPDGGGATRNALGALINRLLDEAARRTRFHRGVIAERWMTHDTMMSIFASTRHVSGSLPPMSLAFRPLYASDVRFGVEYMTTLADLAARAERLDDFRLSPSLEARMQRIEQEYRLHPLSGLMMPALDSAFTTEFQYAANARMAATAIALRWHQHDHGAWPNTLDALVPTYLSAVPIDPLDPTRHPLRYVPAGVIPKLNPKLTFTDEQQTKLPAGPFPILYSMGRDGADDGGTVFYSDRGQIDTGVIKYSEHHGVDQFFLLVPQPPPLFDPPPEPDFGAFDY